MDPENFRLLIHHHHIIYKDENGVIWLSANIGRWVDAIADNLGEVGLLLYESEYKLPQQDTPIYNSNVKLYSLGKRITLKKRLFHRDQVRRVCTDAGQNANGLLIRGVTPHQFLIWRHTPVLRKAFFLVGSLRFANQQFPRTFMDLIRFLLSRYRQKEINQFARSNTLMLANSPVLVSEITQLFGKQAFFVPTNSILRDEFSPLQVRTLHTPWKLLYCGRLDWEKGIGELLQAVAILNRDGYPCQLDVVAEKKEPMYSKMRRSTIELNIDQFVNWHGWVPYGPNLFAYYQKADVFVLPTYSEGFPKVYWEAAANCCPVITTSVGGIPALLTHEEHALLIPPKDVMAIVHAIKRLLSDVKLRESVINQAYSYADAFTVEACAEKFTNVLAQEWK